MRVPRLPLLILMVICLPAAASSQCIPPGVESFDSATVGNPGVYPPGWIDALGTHSWSVGTGSTQTTGTGPSGDHTSGSGNYLFCETSFPTAAGDTFIVKAPCFDATGVTSPTLEFYHHMFGGSIGTLQVEQFDGSLWNVVWCKSGDQGDVWNFAAIPLVPVGGAVTVRFRYIAAADAGGIVVYEGDAAIDDVSFGEPSVQPVPEYQVNQSALSLDINGVFGNTTAPAVINGAYIDCGGVITPFFTNVSLDFCVPVQGHELVVGFGNAVPASLNGLVLPDGQVLNVNAFLGLAFVYGGNAPGFMPLTLPLTIPAAFASPLDLTVQGAALNVVAPLGFSLSAASELHVSLQVGGLPFVLGPTQDETSVTLDVTSGSTCWCAGIPFYGSVYTTIHVMDNGRVRFDTNTSDFTPSSLEAANSVMLGMWTDLDTGTGGGSTVSNPATDVVRVDYLGVNYYAQGASSVSFHIEMDCATGTLSIGSLTGVEQVLGASQDTFLGISPGGGATNPGSSIFSIGGGPGPFTPTDMIYELTASSFVPAFVFIGGDLIEFLPNAGSYTWSGF